MANTYEDRFQLGPDNEALVGREFSHTPGIVWLCETDSSGIRCNVPYSGFFFDTCAQVTLVAPGVVSASPSNSVLAYIIVDCNRHVRVNMGRQGLWITNGGGFSFCNNSRVTVQGPDTNATVTLVTPGYTQQWTGVNTSTDSLRVEYEFNLYVQIQLGDLFVLVLEQDLPGGFQMENSNKCGMLLPAGPGPHTEETVCGIVLTPTLLINDFFKLRTFEDPCGGGGGGDGILVAPVSTVVGAN